MIHQAKSNPHICDSRSRRAMSALRDNPEDICSDRVLPTLTRCGHGGAHMRDIRYELGLLPAGQSVFATGKPAIDR
jgi:hypothetical protein